MKKLRAYLTLAFFMGCASKSPVSGTYVGLYELNIGGNVVCHYLMKKDAALPTVLCHDEAQAWVVPLNEFKNQLWLSTPVLTQSGTMIAFLSEENAPKVEVISSTDKGKTWDVYPSFTKKLAEDRFTGISINKNGSLVASFEGKGKKYEVGQEASLKSKFTAIKSTAKSYPEECLLHYKAPTRSKSGAKIFSKVPASCLSGYVNRLLNQ